MINLISFGTENCEDLLKVFYKNLVKYCKENFKLHYYSINYDSNVIGDNLIKHTYHTKKTYKNAFFYKPFVILKSLVDNNYENFIYLDLDIILTKNFSSNILFNKINNSNTPLSPNHFWENPFYFNNNEHINMGDNVCNLKSIQRCNKYVQACLIVYNKQHLDFLIDWISLVNEDSVIKVSVDDEELYNATLWKYNQTDTLGYICITNGTVDIDNLGCFNSIKLAHEKYESDEFNKSMFTHQNNFYKGFDNKNVMIFHGVK